MAQGQTGDQLNEKSKMETRSTQTAQTSQIWIVI